MTDYMAQLFDECEDIIEARTWLYALEGQRRSWRRRALAAEGRRTGVPA